MFEISLLPIAFLTVVLELPLFYRLGYRDFKELSAFGMANLVSNLLLNEALAADIATEIYWTALFLGEILVVLLEFALMTYVIDTNKIKLFETICVTNGFSLSIGLLMMFLLQNNHIAL